MLDSLFLIRTADSPQLQISRNFGKKQNKQKQALLFTKSGGYMACLGPYRETSGRESGKEREGLCSTFIGVEVRRIGFPGFTLYW